FLGDVDRLFFRKSGLVRRINRWSIGTLYLHHSSLFIEVDLDSPIFNRQTLENLLQLDISAEGAELDVDDVEIIQVWFQTKESGSVLEKRKDLFPWFTGVDLTSSSNEAGHSFPVR